MNRSILLVDDDADDRDIFHEALSEVATDYNFETASHGQEALDKLAERATPPDYIFLDLNMPLMNGVNCLKAIRRQPKLDQVPVFIYSTSRNTDHRKTALDLGANIFITKPSSFAILRQMLNDVLSQDPADFLEEDPA